MKTRLPTITLFAALAATSGAGAADMVPVYKAAPVAIYNWTGFYVGANVGVSAGADPVLQTTTRVQPVIPDVSNQSTHSPFGAIGGLQAGYNWQTGRLVLGVEADAQISGQKSDQSCLTFCTTPIPQFDKVSQQLPWFATVRGRIGYAAGPVLFFATAGVAFTQVRTNYVTNNDGDLSVSVNNSKSGLAVGGGIEAAVFGNWTAKIEYLYLDFGRVTNTFVYPDNFGANTTFASTVSGQVRDHIVRLGVNYRFGDPAPTVYASAAMPTKAPIVQAAIYSWAGLYIGGNAGYSVGRDAVSLLDIGFFGSAEPLMTLVTRGWLGGGQVGYNWQAGHWVAGVEADYQVADQKDSARFNDFGRNFWVLEQKLSWFATGRGRVGYAAGPALFYATGGIAFAGIKTSANIVNATTGTSAASFNNSRTGWVAGAGVEAAFAGSWTAKVEYLYMDFGSFTNIFPAAPALVNLADPNFYLKSRVRDNVVRLGLNYHFGWAGPVTASY